MVTEDERKPKMMTREEVRGLALEGKDQHGLTWPQLRESDELSRLSPMTK